MENVLATEILALGGRDITVGNRVVQFAGTRSLLYKANLHLRTALKILVPIHTFRARNENELYQSAGKVSWETYLNARSTFAVDSVVNSTAFTHSQYVALKVKDAIVDQLRSKHGRRPAVDKENPDIRINIHIDNEDCSIALDSSGDSLHRRGYRLEKGLAPINEVLAAGLVLLSEWDRNSLLIDPMCGSGTIAIEASMLAANQAPGLSRKRFCFENWPDFKAEMWMKLRRQAAEGRNKNPRILVRGFDVSEEATNQARKNLENAGLGDWARFERSDIRDLSGSEQKGTLIINPPYDQRLQNDKIEELYDLIGTRLKHHFMGYRAWIISSNMKALKRIGLKPSRKLSLYNGSLACRFNEYELYAGSLKKRASKTSSDSA